MYVIRKIKPIQNIYKICIILYISGAYVFLIFILILILKFERVILAE